MTIGITLVIGIRDNAPPGKTGSEGAMRGGE
jgi:hypothetical protein